MPPGSRREGPVPGSSLVRRGADAGGRGAARRSVGPASCSRRRLAFAHTSAAHSPADLGAGHPGASNRGAAGRASRRGHARIGPRAATSGQPSLGAHTPAAPVGVPGAPPASAISAPPPRSFIPIPSVSKGSVARVLATARSYSLLLGLAAAVLMFLIVQGRLDRRDPRLTHAPIQAHLKFKGPE